MIRRPPRSTLFPYTRSSDLRGHPPDGDRRDHAREEHAVPHRDEDHRVLGQRLDRRHASKRRGPPTPAVFPPRQQETPAPHPPFPCNLHSLTPLSTYQTISLP